MQKYFWLMLLLLGVLAKVVPAQEAAALSEEAAVQLALQHHPMLLAAQAEANMTSARVDMTKSEARLQMSVNALATASSMRSVTGSPVMPQAFLQSQDRSSLDVNGMVMLPLYTGGRIQSAIKAARLTSAASQLQVAQARIQIAYAARVRLSGWRQALAMLVAAQDNLTAQNENVRVTQKFFDVGKVPRFDLVRAQAAQAEAQQQVANSLAELTAARAQLAQALAVPVDTIPAAPAEEGLAAPPENALQTALSTRPDLLAAAQSINASKATVSSRKANFQPQVYAVGMVEVLAPADMGKSTGGTVGIVAGIPILDGGRRRAEVKEAEQAVNQASAMRDALELQVRADVAGAEARVSAARQNIDTAVAQVTAAEEAYTVAQNRYTGGKGNIVELLDARSALTEAHQNRVKAAAQYNSALAELYLAMGLDVV